MSVGCERTRVRRSFSCTAGQQCRCSQTGDDDAACHYRDNPNYGINSFDSLPWAMVTLFQVQMATCTVQMAASRSVNGLCGYLRVEPNH